MSFAGPVAVGSHVRWRYCSDSDLHLGGDNRLLLVEP
jgi:hypothetical protein